MHLRVLGKDLETWEEVRAWVEHVKRLEGRQGAANNREVLRAILGAVAGRPEILTDPASAADRRRPKKPRHISHTD